MRELVLQQALFGYDDGHRLLQSSFRLANYEKDLLLQLSDLAPGISRLREEGYWTGMPLRESSCYALLRTWPAPEKSRPGCVWTHAIIIPFEYLHSDLDWVWLAERFVRPGSSKRYSEYAGSIVVDDTRSGLDHLTTFETEELASCIYFSKCHGTASASQEELGRQAIAIWSQQWPLLRTALTFRTVEKSNSGRSWLLNFDMMLIDGSLRVQHESVVTSDDRLPVREAAALLSKDLAHSSGSTFHQFRDKYSTGLPLHPKWTGFLAAVETKLRDAIRFSEPEMYRSLLEATARALPGSSDGRCLKEGLVDFTQNTELRLPSEFSIGAVEFIALSEVASTFPHAKFSDETAAWMWSNTRARLIKLLDSTFMFNEGVLQDLLTQLVRVIPIDQLMEGVDEARGVRKRMVSLRPELLKWRGVSELPPEEIVELLSLVSESEVKSINVVRELIFTKDARLAEMLCARFTGEVVFSVCESGSYVTHKGQPHDLILRFAGEVASQYLTVEFVSRLDTTSALLSFAAMLGFINGMTISAGPGLWGNSLLNAATDSPKPQLQTLQAFALSLAVASPRPGAEMLLEYSFEPVHEALRDSRLDYQASVIIEPHLPDVGWWHRWDNCYRLRMAVIRAYVYGNLPPESFSRLASDSRLMGTLFHELESNGDFYSFLLRLRQTDFVS